MTHTRTSRTLAATGVTAALLCALPAVAASNCDISRDGQAFIDWARARSGQNHVAVPDRRPQPLRALLDADRRPEGQAFIDWARAHSAATGAK
jgi:hypothetical protein